MAMIADARNVGVRKAEKGIERNLMAYIPLTAGLWNVKDVFVAANWEVNRKLTYRNPNRDYTALIERTKKYRFKKGVGNDKLSPEQRSAQMKKAWITRHRNMRRKLNST